MLLGEFIAFSISSFMVFIVAVVVVVVVAIAVSIFALLRSW